RGVAAGGDHGAEGIERAALRAAQRDHGRQEDSDRSEERLGSGTSGFRHLQSARHRGFYRTASRKKRRAQDRWRRCRQCGEGNPQIHSRGSEGSLMAGVLVFGEVKDGKLKKVSREALSI